MIQKKFYGVNNFDYLSSEFLGKLNTKTGAIISSSNEKGKVVNNFECYIACPINTEKSSSVKVGDSVKLNLPNSTDVNATIEYIKEENDDKRIIVFKITDNVENLIKYRKIYIDIIWWSYKGLKISNSSLQEENDLYYVQKSKAGYTEKIYVKVLRQNDTYSIVENYTDEELVQLGFDIDYIKKRQELNVYDEILLY